MSFFILKIMKQLKSIFIFLFVLMFSGNLLAAENVLKNAEIMPQFPGGEEAKIKYISENMVYPQAAKDKNIQGQVLLQFVVNKDGSIDNIKVLNSVHESLDNEAIRLVKNMPKWIAGKDKGRTVAVQYLFPIVFLF